MRPKPVCMPVRTTTPRAVPSRTIVPINAHERSPSATASAVFSTGTASPVSTASSHSSSTVSSRRMSAGTMSPTASWSRSPGTSSVTGTRDGVPSRTTSAVLRIWECNASTACSERYSLKNPRPTDKVTMIPMMMPPLASPVTPETAAAASSRSSSGLRS